MNCTYKKKSNHFKWVIIKIPKYCGRLVMMRGEKQWYFSERPKYYQLGSSPGRMHGWRGSQALDSKRHISACHIPLSRWKPCNPTSGFIGLITAYLLTLGTFVCIYIWSWEWRWCKIGTGFSANWIHWSNAVLTLPQRLRRWSTIKTTLFQCIVFAGISVAVINMINAMECSLGEACRARTRRWPNVDLMLARRLRRQPNFKTTLGQHLVSAGCDIITAWMGPRRVPEKQPMLVNIGPSSTTVDQH